MEIVQFYTEMIKIGKNIDFAKDKLDKGGLVAIPTETVYGLGGNALNLESVDKIFNLKNRPSNDPLICHTNSISKIEKELKDNGWKIALVEQTNESIDLKYFNGNPVIKNIKRVSKPGIRVYSKISDLPKTYGGLGISILSTSMGVMSDNKARQNNVGGEVLCEVF